VSLFLSLFLLLYKPLHDEHDDKEREESVETEHSFRGRDLYIYLVFKSQRVENTSAESEKEREREWGRGGGGEGEGRLIFIRRYVMILSRKIVFGNKNDIQNGFLTLYMPVLVHFLRKMRNKCTIVSPNHCIVKLSNFDQS